MVLALTSEEKTRVTYKAIQEFGDDAYIHYIEKHYRIATGITITYWVAVKTARQIYKRTIHISDI